MDYEFLRDITGVVKVRMSMDHEAIGHWFNEEVKGNLALLDEVEQAARTVKGSERSWHQCWKAKRTFGPVPRSDSLSGAMLSPSAPIHLCTRSSGACRSSTLI